MPVLKQFNLAGFPPTIYGWYMYLVPDDLVKCIDVKKKVSRCQIHLLTAVTTCIVTSKENNVHWFHPKIGWRWPFTAQAYVCILNLWRFLPRGSLKGKKVHVPLNLTVSCHINCRIKIHWFNGAIMINYYTVWLAPRAGKMNRISRSDWLPERARWSYLARLGYGLCLARRINHVLVLYPI